MYSKISFVAAAVLATTFTTARAEQVVLDYQGSTAKNVLKERVLLSDAGTIWVYRAIGAEMAALGQLDLAEMQVIHSLAQRAVFEWRTGGGGDVQNGYLYSLAIVLKGNLFAHVTTSPGSAALALIQHLRDLSSAILKGTQSVTTQSGPGTRSFPRKASALSVFPDLRTFPRRAPGQSMPDLRKFPLRKDVPALSMPDLRHFPKWKNVGSLGQIDTRVLPRKRDVSVSTSIDRRTFPSKKDVSSLGQIDARVFPRKKDVSVSTSIGRRTFPAKKDVPALSMPDTRTFPKKAPN